MPLFSVLLPTHDRRDVVGAAIASVLAQTEKDFELLVVGDGCSDGTAEVVTSFNDNRIRWFDFPKAPGFGYANRNRGLREARGRLVAFMAHDDLMLPDHLSLLAKPLASADCVWAYSRPLWIDEAGRVFPFFVNLRTPRAMQSFFTQWNVLPASTVAHKRSCFDEAGMWPEEMEGAGDWDLWKRIIGQDRSRKRIGFVRQPTTLHFRANWRVKGPWGPPPLGFMTGLAVARETWPRRLVFAPAADDPRPLQHQVLETLRTNPDNFMARLRRGVDELQDEMAWLAGLDPQFL